MTKLMMCHRDKAGTMWRGQGSASQREPREAEMMTTELAKMTTELRKVEMLTWRPSKTEESMEGPMRYEHTSGTPHTLSISQKGTIVCYI